MSAKTETSSDPIVTLAGLRKSFGDTEVVRGVDLTLLTGEIFTLLGPSGCGKTTILRMIAGLERPSAGTIHIAGEEVAGGRFVPPEARRLGMVFQSYAVWPHMTVLRNVSWPLTLQAQPDADARARQALAQVKLAGLEDRYPDTLSGGQQQRVALARALASQPRVLLLDEPLSNLDAGLRDQLRAEIAALARAANLSVLLVTHDQEEALSISDRVGVMHAGVLQQVATPTELYERPANAFVAGFVGVMSRLPARRRGGRVHIAGLDLDAPGPDGPVAVGFRPEWASFGTEGLPCAVEQRAFRGPVTRYYVRVDCGDESAGEPGASETSAASAADGAAVIVDSSAEPGPALILRRAWVLDE